MLQKTQGIVLHQLRYGETSIIAHLYTSEFGRHSFIFKGVRGKKSRIRPNMIQPLSVLNIVANVKQGREISIVREASAQMVFHSIPYDVKKSAQAMFMAEVLYRCIKEQEKSPDLYSFLVNSFEYFDLVDKGASNFHLIFLIKLTRYLGFHPTSNNSAEPLLFDFREGIFTDRGGRSPDKNDLVNSALLNEILVNKYDQISELTLDRKRRNELLDFILKFYSIHIEGINNMKSYNVLREIFV